MLVISDVYSWFGRTGDFWGIVIGSGVGIVFGYLASVVHQWWQDKRERHGVRALIRQEYLLNRSFLQRMAAEREEFRLDPDSGWSEDRQRQQHQRNQGRTFAYGPRPNWSRTAISTQLQRFPNVVSDNEAERLLAFYHGLDDISYFWDRLHSALVIDLNTPTQQEVDWVTHRSLMPVTPQEFDRTVDQVWPKFEQLTTELSQFPSTVLSPQVT